MTPREYRRAMAGAEQRARDTAEIEGMRSAVLAWRVAAFSAAATVGKLPSLATVIEQMERTRGRLSPQAQRIQVAELAHRLGVKRQPLSKEAKAALERLKERRDAR